MNYTNRQPLEGLQPESIKVQLDRDFIDMMNYLCTRIPYHEWSGVLLYEYEGTILEPEKMVITPKYIVPMDKGTAGSTEYKYNEKVGEAHRDRHMEYCKVNTDALYWKIGHIHSHNNMDVFFSGTDKAELQDNAGSHNFYLSFICNNRGEYEAVVVVKATANTEDIKVSYKALDDKGNPYEVQTGNIRAYDSKLLIYKCEIEVPESQTTLDPYFIKCTNEIITEATKKPTTKRYGSYYGGNSGYAHSSFPKSRSIPPKYPKLPIDQRDGYGFIGYLITGNKFADAEVAIEGLERESLDPEGDFQVIVQDKFITRFINYFGELSVPQFNSEIDGVLGELEILSSKYVFLAPACDYIQSLKEMAIVK